MKKLLGKVLIFLIVVLFFYIAFYIPAQREREERIAYESEVRSEGYHEGYEEGYDDAFYAVYALAEEYFDWSSSVANEAMQDIYLLLEEVYVNADATERLERICAHLEEPAGASWDEILEAYEVYLP